MDDIQLKKLEARRKNFRDSITYFDNHTRPNIGQSTKTECMRFRTCLLNYIAELKPLDDKYLEQLPMTNDAEAKAYAVEARNCSNFNDLGLKGVTALDVRLIDIEKAETAATTVASNNSNSFTTSNNNGNSNKNKAKLTPLELPTYSGAETENYASFIDTFEEMLDGRGMADVEKFIYLKKCLTGDPFHAISALDNKNQSWDIAKDTLNDLFLDSDIKKFDLLTSFNNLKFSYSDSILHYFSKIDHLVKEITAVGIDTKYFLQYFLWKSISTNNTLAEIYKGMTEEAYPSYDAIMNKKKKVIKMYTEQQKKEKGKGPFKSRFENKHDKSKSYSTVESSLAANIPSSRYSKDGQRKVWCSLCKDTPTNNEHAIFKCPQFINSGQKLARLKSINGCTKCGFLRHQSKNCTFNFKERCRHCEGKHKSWLCSVNEQAKLGMEGECESIIDETEKEREEESDCESEEDMNDNSIEEVHVNMCSTSFNGNCLPSNAILPTFQGRTNTVFARGLKDSACQKNFLSKKLVKDANLTPGKKIELTISGFNSSKTYRTYEVQVPLEFGGKIFDLDMIILPEISTKFSADGISSVANGFESRGYLLADPELKYDRNLVGDLDIILGISATHVFMEKVRTYGENNENYFLETAGGVMPIGHSLTAYSSLKYLPHADQNNEVNKKVKISNYINKSNPSCSSKPEKSQKVPIPKTVPQSAIKKQARTRSRSKSRSKKPTAKKNVASSNRNLPKVKFEQEKTQNKAKLKKKNKKVETSSNVAMATPATIEVRACSLTDANSGSNNENSRNSNLSLVNDYNLSNLGSNFLRSLTPGYTKQEVFGSAGYFGSASEIDLDRLMAETLGYDDFEKTKPFSEVDSKIVDYVYSKT